MKAEELEGLLAKFYEGNTSEQEEMWLAEALESEELPEHLLKEKALFQACFGRKEEEVEVPAGLEEKLNLLIDAKADEEQHFFQKNHTERSRRWMLGAAASLLLLLGLGYALSTMQPDYCPPTPMDTFSDPREAHKVLQATLMEVSANLNQGITQVNETQKDIIQANLNVKEIIN
ncbi:MAG: hypothetical protein J6C87_05845 [Bacteroides sp.]|nr:hypothetical protein [Bacteroides sp.]